MGDSGKRRPPRPPFVVGLLGGIGSGKSAVSGILARHGFVVLDADQIAREVLQEPELRPALRQALGPGIEGPDGALDRPGIAALVFADPARRAALEALIHPHVRQRLLAALEAALAAGQSAVLDVPLLLERGLVERCDYLVYVDAPDEVRRTRAQARGLSAEDWQRREASQAPLAEKRARADLVVDNSGRLAATEAQLAPLFSVS